MNGYNYSEGLGKTQQSILAAIESNPDGAFTTSRLILQGGVKPLHAITTMELPEGWKTPLSCEPRNKRPNALARPQPPGAP
jgi:hypothetical protein